MSCEVTATHIPSHHSNHISTHGISTPAASALSHSLPDGNFSLLALECGQLRLDVLPVLAAINDALHGGDDGVLVGAHLLAGVAISQGDGRVVDGLEIDGDAQRRAELVVAAVPLADRRGRVVDAARDAELAELRGKLGDERLEGLVGRKGHNEDLGGSDDGGEGQNLMK